MRQIQKKKLEKQAISIEDIRKQEQMQVSAIVLNWNESHVSIETTKRLIDDGINVIVVDNGSTDGSQQKFDISFGNKIKLVLLNKNYGSSIARNIGLDLIESEFTFLIDGDILYVPGTIEEYKKLLTWYSNCACIGYFDIEKRQQEGWAHGTRIKEKADQKMLPVTEIGHWYPMAWTQYGLFRTKVLKKYRFVSQYPFNQPGYGFEDDWLYREFTADGWKSYHVNKPYYYHDAHFALNALRENNEDRVEDRRVAFSKKWGENTTSADIIQKLPRKYFEHKCEVDVIMLSYTANAQIYEMTCKAISTLRQSEKNINFNIFLVETNKNFEKEYSGYDAHVIIPHEEKFNYNRFVNIALELCKSDWVVISNNDVEFTPEWFTVAKKEMDENAIDSASPYCKENFDLMAQPEPESIYYGYETGKQVWGYCLIINRRVINLIGKFDEQFVFWYQDDDYGRQLMKYGIRHACIKSSQVNHLISKSHDLIPADQREKYTHGMKQIFEKKYGT